MNTSKVPFSLFSFTPSLLLPRRTCSLVLAPLLFLVCPGPLPAQQPAPVPVFQPPVPDPPRLPPTPPLPVVAPSTGTFDPSQLVRCRPLAMRAVATDGSTTAPQLILNSAMAQLRLPGLVSEGNSAQIWSAFWLELRYDLSKIGTAVTVSCVQGNAQFVGDTGGSASYTATVGAGGILRVPVSFAANEQRARLRWVCQGVGTSTTIQRWPLALFQSIGSN